MEINAYDVPRFARFMINIMHSLITEPLHHRALSRSFSGLMELYELNYLNLRRLLVDLDVLGDYAVSTVRGGLDLHYRMIEKCKYTSTFSLSYRFHQDGHYEFLPDLQIRMYQDARVAEVMSGILHRRNLDRNNVDHYPHSLNSEFSESTIFNRWRLNRFLHRWLRFCLNQGHVFRKSHSVEDCLNAITKIELRG